jgi:putative colanic acid biosynthesis UDP-glucose lipid carrier transferase
MNGARQFYSKVKIISDILIIFACFFATLAYFENRAGLRLDLFNLNTIELIFLLAVALSWYFVSRGTGLYDEFRSRSRVFEIQTVFKSCIAMAFLAIFFIFVLKVAFIDRFFIAVFLTFSLVCLVIWKSAFTFLLHKLRRNGKNLRFILLVGFSNTSIKFMDTLIEHPFLGYRIVGMIDDVDHSDDICTVYLGPLHKLETVLREDNIDEVLIALDPSNEIKIISIINTCEQFPVMVRIIPGNQSYIGSRCTVSLFRDFPIITVRRNPLDDMQWRLVKRCFDIVFSLCFLLLVASWFFPILALAIKLTSPGPVFFKQERWGKKNKPISCYKFRSMYVYDSKGQAQTFRQATRMDPRVTWLGKFLRKTNIDEFPQFINVLWGNMSVVGPRPHPTPLNLLSSNGIDRYLLRHLVKPGITGWAQIHGFRGNTEKVERMQKRVEHDIWYIENWTFPLDMNIIMLTLLNLLKRDENAF